MFLFGYSGQGMLERTRVSTFVCGTRVMVVSHVGFSRTGLPLKLLSTWKRSLYVHGMIVTLWKESMLITFLSRNCHRAMRSGLYPKGKLLVVMFICFTSLLRCRHRGMLYSWKYEPSNSGYQPHDSFFFNILLDSIERVYVVLLFWLIYSFTLVVRFPSYIFAFPFAFYSSNSSCSILLSLPPLAQIRTSLLIS